MTSAVDSTTRAIRTLLVRREGGDPKITPLSTPGFDEDPLLEDPSQVAVAVEVAVANGNVDQALLLGVPVAVAVVHRRVVAGPGATATPHDLTRGQVLNVLALELGEGKSSCFHGFSPFLVLRLVPQNHKA